MVNLQKEYSIPQYVDNFRCTPIFLFLHILSGNLEPHLMSMPYHVFFVIKLFQILYQFGYVYNNILRYGLNWRKKNKIIY